jgi:site-specific DNA-cytosine methylase
MKVILHLCADIGSDSYPYQTDDNYEVIKVGKNIGVENYTPDRPIYGIIANPVCTEFSTAMGFHKKRDPDLSLLRECQRIILESNPEWYVIENPYNGTMSDYLGKPDYVYQPWEFGSPWTKKTALWGNFKKPIKLYSEWEQVKQNKNLYVRPGRNKPSLAFLHKSAIDHIPEFEQFKQFIDSDSSFRSLCSQGFANAFKLVNW